MKRKYRIEKRREKLELKSLKANFKDKKKEYSILKDKSSALLKENKVNRIIKTSKLYKEAKKELGDLNSEIKEAKTIKSNAKKEYKLKKKFYKKKYPSKVKKDSIGTAKKIKSQVFNAVLTQDEDLGKYVNAKQEYSAKLHTTKKVAKGTKFVVSKSSNILYGGINRTYNKAKGKGFTRTPKNLSWQHKLKERVRNNRKVIAIRNARQKTKRYTAPFEFLMKRVFRNPLKATGLLSLIVLSLFVSLFISSISPANMNERNMNETWIYFTKLDRENSTDKVIYNSNIEDYIYFLNYRYNKVAKEIYGEHSSAYKDKTFPETIIGKNYLKGMWDFFNKDENNLKSIDDMILHSNKHKLDEKELKEYRELLKVSHQIGKFPYAKELDNFLYSKKDKEYNSPVKILERFGYKTKNEMSETSTIYAKANQYIYASFTGSVNLDGGDVSITQGTKRITFYNLQNIRVKDGEQALRGEEIGKVGAEDKQVVKYEKLKDGEWIPVNIGFYLSNVEYIQKTEVIRDFDLDKDKSQRVKKFVEYVKKHIPNATNEGISAVLGNFDIESGVNPKRAEGDYLPAPIGASEGSWDDPKWLDIGGVEIYNGRYPNIVRRGLGLGQWTDTLDGAVRHTLLRDFAKQKEKKWYDLELQVDFIIHGDNPYYRQHFYDIVTSNEDVAVLTRKFLNNWEGNPSDKIDNRIEHAKSFLQYLNRPKVDKLNIEGTFDEAVALEVIAQLNAHRRAHGLPDLAVNPVFDDGTELRAQEFSVLARRGYNNPMELHKRLDGSDWHTAFPGGVLSENVAYAYNGADGMMGFWKSSPSHNAAMLNPRHTAVTVKVFYTGGQYYGVQIFS